MRFDPIWRRIKPDVFTEKFEGRFSDRLQRLDGLNNWGSLGWLYPHAAASKQAHHYGLERNAMQFLAGDEQRQKYRASFRTSAHVLHWGHLPLSYATEEGVLRAAHINASTKGLVEAVIGDVIKAGALECDAKDHDCAESIRSGDNPFYLYRWLTAALVARDWKAVWKTIKSAMPGEDLDEVQTRHDLIRTLTCGQHRGNRILTLCNEADYVPRDLLQAGTAWLTFDIEALWEPNPLGSEAAREWSLVKSAKAYLDDRFFHQPDALLVHSLAARAIAGGLEANGLTVTSLMALTDEGDSDFVANLPRYHRDRLERLRDLAVSGRMHTVWDHVGTFENVSLPDGSQFDMEDHLTGRTGAGRVSYPFTSGVSVMVSPGSTLPEILRGITGIAGPNRRYATVHVHHDNGKPARPALDVVAKLSTFMTPTAEVGNSLMSWLLHGVVEQRATGLGDQCGEAFVQELEQLQKYLAQMLELQSMKSILDHGLTASLLGVLADPSAGNALDAYGEVLLRLPWAGVRRASGQRFMTVLRDAATAKSATGSASSRGYALEAAVAADQWLAKPHSDNRMVFLGATLLGKDGQPACEWDIVRMDLLPGDNWAITAIECTVARTEAKDGEARVKLDEMRTHLQGRFSDLAYYKTLLATIDDDGLSYDDAARGFEANANP